MPELPEVETMCRGIAAIVRGRILRAERPPCPRRPIAIEPRIDRLRRRVEGKTVAAVERAGKRVVIWLAASRRAKPNDAIVIEPRMTGLVLLADPPTKEHLRFHLKLAGVAARDLWFWDRRGLGTVRLLTAAEFAARFGDTGTALGPDALRVTPDGLRTRLCRSRRAIKVALLDQRAIAGIGNLYASEMLHLAAIHPAARCDRLTRPQWSRLHRAMLEVLNLAIRHEGSTLSDGTYRNALNEAGAYQNHHRVYDRAGQPCPTCRSPIARIVQAQRSTFFCRTCQRRKPVGGEEPRKTRTTRK